MFKQNNTDLLNIKNRKNKDKTEAPINLVVVDENSTTYALNILATLRQETIQLSAFADYLDEKGEGTPIEGMSTPEAVKIFKALEKSMFAKSTVHGYVDKLVRENDLIVTSSALLYKDRKPVLNTTGTIGLPATQEIPRDAANFLLVMTSKDAEKTTVSEIGKDSAVAMAMPWVALRGERVAVTCDMGNNMLERDAMITRMSQNSNKAFALRITSLVRAHVTMRDLVELSPDFQNWYNKNKGTLPQTPMYISKVKSFVSRHMSGFRDCWIAWQKSNGYRGGERGRGEVSAGYYRFDAPKSFLRNIDLVSDLLMVSTHYNLKVIEFQDCDYVEVVRILIHNNIAVISPAGRGVYSHKKNKNSIIVVPGHYCNTKETRLVFRNIPLRTPNISGKMVTSQDPVILESTKHTIEFCRDVLREDDSVYCTMPSIRAADGICIRVDGNKTKGNHQPEAVLRTRFSQAVHWRNWYIFMRASYVARDSMRHYFPEFLYPKHLKDDEILFQGAAISIQTFEPVDSDSILSFLVPTPTLAAISTVLDEFKIEFMELFPNITHETMCFFLHLFNCNSLINIFPAHQELIILDEKYSNKTFKKGLRALIAERNVPFIDFGELPDDNPLKKEMWEIYKEYWELPFNGDSDDDPPPKPVSQPSAAAPDEPAYDPFAKASAEIVAHVEEPQKK